MSRTPARTAVFALAAAAALIATPATAHVSVSSPDAEQEGYGKIVFRVPNESESAATERLTVTLPDDTPFAFLSAETMPGWDVEIERGPLPEPVEIGDLTLTEAPLTVTWTATGDGVPPEEFAEFALSGGPFPAAEEMSFEALQVYDDGERADWSQPVTGDEEPERPAPVLEIGPVAAAAETPSETAAAESDAGEQESSDLIARGLAAVAVVLAAGALVAALRHNRPRA